MLTRSHADLELSRADVVRDPRDLDAVDQPRHGSRPGNAIELDIRGKRVTATIVELPFYKNASHR